MNTPLYLIGFMGAGKSTIATQLAHHFSLPCIDLDVLFETQQGYSIAQWFSLQGEASFREIERELLTATQNQDAIIATGGGIVLHPYNRTVLQDASCTTIWLHPAWDVLWDRIQQSNRPLVHTLQSEEALKHLWHTRIPHYRSCADVIVTTENPLSELITILS
jgi:shikimate kinase